MKRIFSFLFALLLSQEAIAYDWITSWQAREGGEWTHQFKRRTRTNGPHAVKVVLPNGEEKVFICNDIRAGHGLPLMPPPY